MTFRFENIGPIHSADIKLGDLTIIAGRNNTGKTYLVYALYGFLKQWEGWSGTRIFLPNRDGESNPPIRSAQIVPALAESGRASYPATPNYLRGIRRDLVDRLARDFSARALPAVFSTTSEDFRNAQMSVELSERDLNSELPTAVAMTVRPVGRVTLEYNDNELSFAVDRNTAESPGSTWRRVLEEVICHLLLRFFCSDFPRPFILSAERFGISLFYKELDFAKSQLVDAIQKMDRDNDSDNRNPYLLIDKKASKYAQPIKDNIDYTRSIHEMQNDRSPLAKNKLFDDIKNIMGGYYKASRDTITFQSGDQERGQFDIPLHLASSSARGLSDLYFYLRHKADKGDLLMIDEPESHLDTSNQVFLARILARFVRAGIKILITTHSDYLIKEINNLIMLSQLSDHDRILQKLGYSDLDRLNPLSVRAYVAGNHQVGSATVDEFGIDMPVFDYTIDAINRVSRTLAAEVEAGRSRV